MLDGQGVKLNTLVGEEPLVTTQTSASGSSDVEAEDPGCGAGRADKLLPSSFLARSSTGRRTWRRSSALADVPRDVPNAVR